MKKFTVPVAEINKFQIQDVITASGEPEASKPEDQLPDDEI